jgi:hypothetical protein
MMHLGDGSRANIEQREANHSSIGREFEAGVIGRGLDSPRLGCSFSAVDAPMVDTLGFHANDVAIGKASERPEVLRGLCLSGVDSRVSPFMEHMATTACCEWSGLKAALRAPMCCLRAGPL